MGQSTKPYNRCKQGAKLERVHIFYVFMGFYHSLLIGILLVMKTVVAYDLSLDPYKKLPFVGHEAKSHC